MHEFDSWNVCSEVSKVLNPNISFMIFFYQVLHPVQSVLTNLLHQPKDIGYSSGIMESPTDSGTLVARDLPPMRMSPVMHNLLIAKIYFQNVGRDILTYENFAHPTIDACSGKPPAVI
jgi:hypothetical protein